MNEHFVSAASRLVTCLFFVSAVTVSILSNVEAASAGMNFVRRMEARACQAGSMLAGTTDVRIVRDGMHVLGRSRNGEIKIFFNIDPMPWSFAGMTLFLCGLTSIASIPRKRKVFSCPCLFILAALALCCRSLLLGFVAAKHGQDLAVGSFDAVLRLVLLAALGLSGWALALRTGETR